MRFGEVNARRLHQSLKEAATHDTDVRDKKRQSAQLEHLKRKEKMHARQECTPPPARAAGCRGGGVSVVGHGEEVV